MQYRYLLLVLSLFFSIRLEADEWKGAEYAQNSSVQLTHAERLLKNIFFAGNEKILDVGCGDGKITASLSKKVPQGIVIGIDPSQSMLSKAQELRKEGDLPNLFFYEGAAESFLLNEQFDHVFAIFVLHWVKEQENALRNIYAHVKPKGQVHFILAPSKEGLPFASALQKTLLAWDAEFKGFVNSQHFFDMETYRKLMVAAGFHVEAIHYVYHESIHETKGKLLAWVKQWLPHGKYLPDSKQDAFMEELISNYLVEVGVSPDTSEPVRWGEYVLIVEGRKL